MDTRTYVMCCSGRSTCTLVRVAVLALILLVVVRTFAGAATRMVDGDDGHVSVWIEKDYRDCLQTALPCACTDRVSAILIVVDAANHIETIVDASESSFFYVHLTAQGHSYHLNREDDTSREHEQWYDGDTLYSRNEDGIQVFIRISMPGDDKEIGRLLEYVNASYLKAMLANRGFSPDALSGLLIEGLRCNNDLGVRTQIVMHDNAECPRVLEDQGNALVVYEMLGNCDVKTYSNTIRWREIFRVSK